MHTAKRRIQPPHGLVRGPVRGQAGGQVRGQVRAAPEPRLGAGRRAGRGGGGAGGEEAGAAGQRGTRGFRSGTRDGAATRALRGPRRLRLRAGGAHREAWHKQKAHAVRGRERGAAANLRRMCS